MTVVNVHQAKTHFSKLLGRVESGEEIVIAKSGKPVARLVPVREAVERREPGSAKGRLRLTSKFFEPLPDELLKEFHG